MHGPPNSVSCGEFHKEKINKWNDIYSSYKERCPESQRMLQQVKKRQQNLVQSSFIEMCEKSMEQDNARFERSAEMSPAKRGLVSVPFILPVASK